jgi:hypothetical protein
VSPRGKARRGRGTPSSAGRRRSVVHAFATALAFVNNVRVANAGVDTRVSSLGDTRITKQPAP